jgi:hypothetical protein
MAFGRVLRKVTGKADPKEAPKDLPPEPNELSPHVDWVTITDTYLWTYANLPDPNRKQGIFHPSAGLHPETAGCQRLIIFDLLMANRSKKKISAKLAKVLENGTNRHVGLQAMFHDMARRKHMGVIHYEAEVLGIHPSLPISGKADGLVVMNTGHRYLHDYKTIGPDDFAKTYEPTFKHRLQLNTYMGMLGVRTGYMIYENKKGQDWATPMPKFRVDFNAMLWQETENFCVEILQLVAREELPEYSETICKADITFCQYEQVCMACRTGMASFQNVDQRDPATKKRHLEVVG